MLAGHLGGRTGGRVFETRYIVLEEQCEAQAKSDTQILETGIRRAVRFPAWQVSVLQVSGVPVGLITG
jgi:hypothetical protein